jgi:hypothetical protein
MPLSPPAPQRHRDTVVSPRSIPVSVCLLEILPDYLLGSASVQPQTAGTPFAAMVVRILSERD